MDNLTCTGADGSLEFNLLTEPWIMVVDDRLKMSEVSLVDALTGAQHYQALAGEMPTQDFAMLRLLLACTLTIFYRYDADGNPDPIDEYWDAEDVLDRWKEYHESGKLPETAVRKYFESYSERFWLFHPETPFYQVADLGFRTDYKAQGLYGNIRSSNHNTTKHHFSMKDGEELKHLSYPEAARWLLHLNGYCVNTKNKKGGVPGTADAAGVGYLGKISGLYLDAENLFDLLMFNLVPLDPNGEPWKDPDPMWENPVHTDQSTPIEPPDNLPELYTMQSRRVLLKREDGVVTGFRCGNGDRFPIEDYFNEPMTVWVNKNKDEKGKKRPARYIPKKHKASIQTWREFSSIFTSKSGEHTPGIVQWASFLRRNGELQGTFLRFHTVEMSYDGMSYNFVDCISNGVSLSSDLLIDLDGPWMNRITDEIEKCRSVTEKAIEPFCEQMEKLLRIDGGNLMRSLTDRFYWEIDGLFRNWLSGIDPKSKEMNAYCLKWEGEVKHCAERIVREYISSLGNNCYKTRTENGSLLSVPKAYSDYRLKLH